MKTATLVASTAIYKAISTAQKIATKNKISYARFCTRFCLALGVFCLFASLFFSQALAQSLADRATKISTNAYASTSSKSTQKRFLWEDLPNFLAQDSTQSSTKDLQHFAQSSSSKTYKKCAACHGNDGKKSAPGARGDITIAGLPRYKIIGDLQAYKRQVGNKGGTKAIMQEQAKSLSQNDIQALAEYISKLPK